MTSEMPGLTFPAGRDDGEFIPVIDVQVVDGELTAVETLSSGVLVTGEIPAWRLLGRAQPR